MLQKSTKVPDCENYKTFYLEVIMKHFLSPNSVKNSSSAANCVRNSMNKI